MDKSCRYWKIWLLLSKDYQKSNMKKWLNRWLGISLIDIKISVISEQIAGLKERERLLEVEVSKLRNELNIKEVKDKVQQKNIRIGE